MFIDTHSHLTYDSYGDIKSVIAEYKNANVTKAITVGFDINSSILGCELSEKEQSVYFAIGVHPSDADTLTNDGIDTLIKLSKNKKCVAFGEIGLDYHYDDTDKPKQQNAFLKQLELADSLSLPIIIHSRDDVEDMVKLLKNNSHYLKNGGVMHCFSHSSETAKIFLDLGLHISFAGPITFKNSRKAEEVIKIVPDNRILAETDCPYLSPEPFRGKQNSPKNVVFVYKKIAEIKNTEIEKIEESVWTNAHSLFKRLGE